MAWGEETPIKDPTRIEKQTTLSLQEMVEKLPKASQGESK